MGKNIWTTLLNTLHSAVKAMQYQSDKMEIQLSLLSTMATHIIGIDVKISNLNGLIGGRKLIHN